MRGNHASNILLRLHLEDVVQSYPVIQILLEEAVSEAGVRDQVNEILAKGDFEADIELAALVAQHLLQLHGAVVTHGVLVDEAVVQHVFDSGNLHFELFLERINQVQLLLLALVCRYMSQGEGNARLEACGERR